MQSWNIKKSTKPGQQPDETPCAGHKSSYLVDGGLEGGHGLEGGEEEEEGEGDEDDVLHDAPLLRPQLLLAQVHPPHDRLVAAVAGGLQGRHSTHLQFHENVLNIS